jgi:hypothetical protein
VRVEVLFALIGCPSERSPKRRGSVLPSLFLEALHPLAMQGFKIVWILNYNFENKLQIVDTN